MQNTYKIINLSKNAKGELIFEFLPENITVTSIIKGFFVILLKITAPMFRFFDFLASKKKLVISAVGLGIGLGLSVLVTQRPDAIQAFPELVGVTDSQVRASQLIISSIDLSAPVVTGSVQDLIKNAGLSELIHDERSANLGGQTPVVISDVSIKNILSDLESVKIGDTVLITGSNSAQYTYKVTEIRDMKAEYLPNVIGANAESLILYKAKNLLRTQLYMLIAKPVL